MEPKMTVFITSDVKESPKFFREFSLTEAPVKASLTITGLGLYNAYINGTKAGDAYLAPGCNDYDGYLRYQVIDVTDLLQTGENVIEVFLGNGWYKGRFGLMPVGSVWGEEYLLKATLRMEGTDGSETVIEADGTWNAQESVFRSNGIYDGEVRDDTFLAAEVLPCRKVERAYALIAQDEVCPPIRAKLERKPELIITPKGDTVLDFGQNMAGVVRVHNRLKKGESIHLQFGEILIDGEFCNTNYRSAVGGYTYVSDGVEKDVEAEFTYFGFRYVKVETAAEGGAAAFAVSAAVDAAPVLSVEPVKASATDVQRPAPSDYQVDPADFTGVVLYTDLADTMQVHTSNAKLNRLLENSLWGQRGNFLDTPTDCPQRDERLGWTGDAQVFANTACFHMNCEDFYKKFIMDLRYDQTAYLDGDVAMFSPGLKAPEPGGPAWADAATIIPWTMYEHYGNEDNLRAAYPLMHDYAEKLIGKDQAEGGAHILRTGHAFGDWLALDGASPNSFKGGTDDTYVRTVYYWYSLELTAKAAQVLGESADHERYQNLADEVKAAIRSEFFSPNGRLCIDTQTGYILALHFGLYTDKEKVIEGFKDRLSKDKLRLKTGFVGTGFLLQTLFEAGMDDYAYRMLFTDEFPGWFYAVNLGATTIWERWNSVMPDGSLSPTGMNSLNHYSYGAVASAVYSYIAGLRLAAPGWKQAIIQPRPNYRLQHIDIAFDSPAGTWESSWSIEADGSLSVRVVVPEGAAAKIVLPYYPADTLDEATANASRGGDPVSGTSTVLSSGSGAASGASEEGACGASDSANESGVYEVGAGTYEYHYTPTVDFTHPYDGSTFVQDIVTDENAVKALTSAYPGAFEGIFATVEDNAATSLPGAIFFTPIPDLPKKIDEILRSVAYEVK